MPTHGKSTSIRSGAGSRSFALLRGLAALCLAAAGLLSASAAGSWPLEPVTADARALKDAVRAQFESLAPGVRAERTSLQKVGEATVNVVEYFNAGLNHYFITADPAEIAALDGGGLGGAWKRTGRSFLAWPAGAGPAGSVPVCRFFGTDKYRSNGTRIGPNSHFYTADPVECAFVKTAYQSLASDGRSYPAWTFEGNAFSVILPAPGCPAGTEGLYRAYNNGANGDPNHRYSTDRALLAAMGGWTLEGLVMCVPAAAATTSPLNIGGPIFACTSASCVPAIDQGVGIGLVDIVVELVNTSTSTVTVRVPAGFVFRAISEVYQNGLLIYTVEVTIGPGGRVPVMFRLFCLNAARHQADSSAQYVPEGVTGNPAILDLIGFVRGRLSSGAAGAQSPRAIAFQFGLWELTDGIGSLSAAQRSLLDRILDGNDLDPTLISLVLEFQDLLSLPRQ